MMTPDDPKLSYGHKRMALDFNLDSHISALNPKLNGPSALLRRGERSPQACPSSKPIRNQLSGLLRIVLHADPPDQLFRSHSADVGRKPLDAPGDGPVNALAAQRFGMFQILGHIIRHILRVISSTGCFFEPG